MSRATGDDTERPWRRRASGEAFSLARSGSQRLDETRSKVTPTRHGRSFRLFAMRHVILVSSLITAGLLTSAIAGQSSVGTVASGQAPTAIKAAATSAAPQSRVEGDEAMDAAVAAAVIGAVSGQFGDRAVTVKLDSVKVEPSSIRDRSVSGDGRLQIGDAQDWLAFQFKAQYDTQGASVTYPHLTIGGTGGGTLLAPSAPMAKTLLTYVDRVVSREFAGQPVVIAFEQVKTIDASGRYVRVEAVGSADFRAEGRTPAFVQALYDRKTNEWINVGYELGTTANWSDVETVAVKL